MTAVGWDAAAGLPLRPEVRERLVSLLAAGGGNPSSVHAAGRAARAPLDAARLAVARVLGASSPREIIFTGSGSEAAALAVMGSFRARADDRRRKVVVSAIEHPCVLSAARALAREGAEVVEVPCGRDGVVSLDALADALGDGAAVCSLMWVNNETGVVQPVAEAARLARERGVVFHSDAVQAAGRLPVSVAGVDLISLSAHKLGGPAGVGILYNRRGVAVAPLTPGHQEDGRRGGTQAVAAIAAAALAVELAWAEQAAVEPRLAALRETLEREVRARWPDVVIQGHAAPRVGGIVSLTFPGRDAEALLVALDLEGVHVSMGAACASGSLEPSHVLTAMGLPGPLARSTLRFSLPPGATAEQLRTVIGALERTVDRTGP